MSGIFVIFLTFVNLASQAQKMVHVNALVAMWPSFEKVEQDPYGSINLGNGYILLRPADESGPYYLSHKEEAFDIFCSGHQESEGIDRRSVYRWGRLKLPTAQIARLVWKELE